MNNRKTDDMTKCYANLMAPGYKSRLVELDVSSFEEAKSKTIELAHTQRDCIGYSTAVKEPKKKMMFF